MMRRRISFTIAATVICAAATNVLAPGDATHGEQVFKKCAVCHSKDPGVNKVGPSLAGVIGRKAGTLPNYHYSAAMRSYGQVWTADTLATYLRAPQQVVKGTRMTFAGLRKEQEVADVIAYLQTLSAPASQQ